MTIASTPTLLSLDRFARIVGLNPVHFAGATAGAVFPLVHDCPNTWSQYPYQTPAEFVSREEVAAEIAKAEHEIKQMLGYSPAPDWEVRETHPWPGHGMQWRHQPQRMTLDYGKLIAPGVRAALPIEMGAEVVYSDADGDGFAELATIAVATEVEDIREIKLFFQGHDALPEAEIRPLRRITLAAGVATIEADSWLFIDPALWQEMPTGDDPDEIDISTPDNYVAAVDVMHVFNDSAAYAANLLIARPGALALGFCHHCGYGTCANCGATTQGGTFAVFDTHASQVLPYPASYRDDAWHGEMLLNCGVPRLVSFNYYAGDEDKRYLSGQRLDPLSDYWAEVIAWMAAARLPRGVCGCDNVRERIYAAQQDMTRNDQTNAFTRTERMDIFRSAFGTRAGEVRAWQAVTRIAQDQVVMGGGGF